MNNIINEQKQKINDLYERYCDSLKQYLDEECFFDVVHDTGNKIFEYVEQCSAHNNSIEEIKESDWNQWLAETCIEMLELIKAHYVQYRIIMNDNSLKPSSTAFACMQRMVMDFDKDKAKEIKELFKENDLPTYGFDKKRKKYMTKTHERILSLILGIISLISFALLIIFMDEPTPLKYKLISILVSLLAGISAALLTGSLYLKVSEKLNAKSGFAVFVFSVLILNGLKFI